MIKLITKKDNVSLTTGGVPQSEVNGLLLAQEERLREEYEEEMDGLNTVIDGLEARNAGLELDIGDLTASNTQLNEQVTELNGEVEVLNTTIIELNDEIDELEQMLESAKPLPEEAFIVSGNCQYKFSQNAWNWFIEGYGDRITTENIRLASYMFYNSSDIKNVPFDLNFADTISNCNNLFGSCSTLTSVPKLNFHESPANYCSFSEMFSNCFDVKDIDTIKNIYPSEMAQMFQNCYRLRYAPKFENVNWSRIQTYANAACRNMFSNCYSLREYPRDILDNCWGTWASYLYALFYNMAQNCYVLDEIKDMKPITGNITSNMFLNSCVYTHRLKDFTFALQEDGTPYTAKWKNQTLDFTKFVGHLQDNTTSNIKKITGYNSGITEDKAVYDDATYQALKNDPDWFATNIAYSRYNKESALRTIQSLPDTSAFGTNTIIYEGEQGYKTDGGAINTLTAEQIAVAAAKGWTVSFV